MFPINLSYKVRNNTAGERHRIVSKLDIVSGQVSRFICSLGGKNVYCSGFLKKHKQASVLA